MSWTKGRTKGGRGLAEKMAGSDEHGLWGADAVGLFGGGEDGGERQKVYVRHSFAVHGPPLA